MRHLAFIALLTGLALALPLPAAAFALDQAGYTAIQAELDTNEALIRDTATDRKSVV